MKNKNRIIPIVAVLLALAFVGNAMAFSFAPPSPPETPYNGKTLENNKQTQFPKDTPIGMQFNMQTTNSFSMEKMFGKYSNADSFVIALNNTTAVDFANETALGLPNIVTGAEITFEHAVDGTIKFIPKKITGDKPQLIITVNRSDGASQGMNVTISIEMLKEYLGGNIDIQHTVNVTALMTSETVTIHIEHFSTQTLTAEGNGTPANTSVIVSFILTVISVIFFMVYAVIHYKQSKNLLKTDEMNKAKKATLWIGIITLILAIVEFAYPFMYL